MRSQVALLTGALLVMLSGCAPQVDTAAEAAAIRDVENQLLQATRAKDMDQTLSLYTDDAQRLPPLAPIQSGKEGIRAAFEQEFAIPNAEFSWQAIDVKVSRAGDIAYSVGTYEATWDDPEGKRMSESGKYVTVYEKQADGTWKIKLDTWSANAPPAGLAD